MSFAERLADQFAAQRHLCVGIDPHASLLTDWGLTDSAQSAERMGREVVAAAAEFAACVKPQIAFFERFGQAGYSALERVLADARQAGLLVIADAKRGDIGTSFAAYAEAWLTPGAPLESDAMTAVAYQGFESLGGALRLVREHGKGLFVLAATSNPEARLVQCALRADGRTVAQAVVEDAMAMNVELVRAGGDQSLGAVGVVLGATLELAAFGIVVARSCAPALPVLAPGFGAQGGRIEEVKATFGSLSCSLLASESRSLLAGGPQGLTDRVHARAEAIAVALQR